MLYLFALLVAWICAAIGWGSWVILIRKWLKLENPFAFEILEPVLGLIVLTSAANVLNFFVPLTQGLDLILLFIGWGLLVWRISLFPQIFKRPFWLSIGLIWIGVVSTHAGWRAWHSDSALYHIPAIRWLVTFQTPAGLGNLHGRLAYNSSWFSISAILANTVSPYTVNFVGLASYVLLTAFGMVVLKAGSEIVQLRGRAALASFFMIGAALVGFAPILLNNLSAPSSDHPVLLLLLLTVYAALRAISTQDPKEFDYNICLVMVLALFATTVKVSAIVILIVPIALVIDRYRRQFVVRKQLLIISALAFLVIFVPWLVRNVLLSGCLVYPVANTCIYALPWSVPRAQVEDEARWIASWARMPRTPPDKVLANWNWLGSWFRQLSASLDLLFPVICLIAGLVLSLAAFKSLTHRRWMRGFVTILLGLLLGLGYWFVTAPDLRFGLAWIWSISLLLFALGMWGISQREHVRYVLAVGAIVLILAGGWSIYQKGVIFYYARGLRFQNYLHTIPEVPKAEYEVKRTNQGIPINVPKDSNSCWWTEMCTPNFKANVYLRTLEGGRPMFYASR